MTCPQCANQITDNARFCGYCGAQMQVPQPELPATPQPVAYEAPQQPASYYPQQPAAPALATRPFFFHGDGQTLFGIWIINVLLSIVTLGIYSFWARSKVRQYMWGQTEWMGDRFAYHGTGLELFLGALKAGLLLILLYGQMFVLQAVLKEAGAIIGVLILVLGIALIAPLAIAGSWRYRLSRTSYRGIRFSYRGSMKDFCLEFYKNTFLSVVTFGFYTPWYLTKIHAHLLRNSYFGSEKFEFDGNGGDLFLPWFISGILTFFTLGLSAVWFVARRTVYFWTRTTISSARFTCSLDPMNYVGVALINGLLTLVTFGIYTPWATVNLNRAVINSLGLIGSIDLDRVRQQAVAASATGEELASFLNVDSGFGL